ncbi:hypothetical protein GV64_11085 [Endozoicomonas elysicola]|uniref:Phage tail protein n=2 Tax=Endozoicomonas elysicola TaxID=305900 RepID=A0A081KAN8_9GAMM|nr:hypothetical protein GV64_11085 [Endozoicomonas elysicola]
MSALDIAGDFITGSLPPLPGYRFAAVLMTGLVPQIMPLDMRFQKISGLKLTRELREDRDNFLLKPSVNRRDLVLERGMPRLPTPLQATHLLEQAFWNSRLMQTEILVVLLSDKDIPYPLQAWVVHKAYLTGLEWGELNGEENSVMIESMTYSYSSLIPVPVPLAN